jgi:Right handed beta helix region
VIATGFDVGIYVGPGVTSVTVTGAHVTRANDEGILVQDTSGIVIEESLIEGNGVKPHLGHPDKGVRSADLTENKGIVLAATVDCIVRNNVVRDNLADGGISVLDDGTNHPFAPETVTTDPIASTGNLITGNIVRDNVGGCGIVVAAKNPGAGVYSANVSGNDVVVINPVLAGLPRVGGIIVAGGAFGPVTMDGNIIENNTVTGGLIPGISIHAFGPGTITATRLIGNTLSNNGAGEISGNTTGIEIFALFVAPPDGPGLIGHISGTAIEDNTINNDHYGVFHLFDTSITISGLTTSNVAIAVYP